MSKIIDITDKLDFDGNPKIKIKNQEIEVNADASTMLKIMGVLGDKDEPGPKEVMDMYNLMFDPPERKKIEKMNLRFKDFTMVVYTAIGLIQGDDTPGEQ